MLHDVLEGSAHLLQTICNILINTYCSYGQRTFLLYLPMYLRNVNLFLSKRFFFFSSDFQHFSENPAETKEALLSEANDGKLWKVLLRFLQ
jgi:hypothetical protein